MLQDDSPASEVAADALTVRAGAPRPAHDLEAEALAALEAATDAREAAARALDLQTALLDEAAARLAAVQADARLQAAQSEVEKAADAAASAQVILEAAVKARKDATKGVSPPAATDARCDMA